MSSSAKSPEVLTDTGLTFRELLTAYNLRRVRRDQDFVPPTSLKRWLGAAYLPMPENCKSGYDLRDACWRLDLVGAYLDRDRNLKRAKTYVLIKLKERAKRRKPKTNQETTNA